MRVVMLLGELALRALLLAAIGTTVAWIVRRRGAEVQHAIWRMVLAGMLALPLLTLVLPPLPVLPSPSPVVMSLAAGAVTAMQPSSSGDTPVSVDRGPSNVSFNRSRTSSVEWPVLALVVYAAVAAFLLARAAMAVRCAKRMASSGIRIKAPLAGLIELRESPLVLIPFTTGRRDPVIVLPADWRRWDDFKLRSVVAHELAHIRRGDWTTALAASINRAVFWFHPLAWWLERHLAALAEEACDATAIRSAGDGPRYARVVLDFAETVSGRFAGATSIARTSNVGRRINGILEGGAAASRAISGFASVAMLAVAAPALYAAAAFQLSAQAQAPALAKSPPSAYSAMPQADAYRAILADGWKLTPAEAASLESELERDPEDLSARIRLLSYYTQYVISRELRSKHLLWLIEHHPDADVFQVGTVATSVVPDYSGSQSPDIDRAKTLWLRQAEQFATNPRVLANAATAFRGPDASIALDLVKRARMVEPNNPEWVDWLGAVYAAAVRSSIAGGQPRTRTSSGRKSEHSGFLLPLAESNRLKSELETSSDAELLGATAEELIGETTRLASFAGQEPEIEASGAFGKQLLLRAKQLDPNNPRWK